MMALFALTAEKSNEISIGMYYKGYNFARDYTRSDREEDFKK